MTFLYPGWLLGVIPLLLYIFVALRQSEKTRLQREALFFAPSRSGGGRVALLLLVGAGITLLLAFAEPVTYRVKPIFEKRGVAVVIGIDISKSMLAEDAVFPEEHQLPRPIHHRLNRARQLVLNLLDEVRGEQVGIFVFAAHSYELVPLTTDYGFCRYQVENLDYLALAEPGSNLVSGLECGLNIVDRSPDISAGIILLLSDGEDIDNSPTAIAAIARKAAQSGRRIYVCGLGHESPELIPIRTPDGRRVVGYYRDAGGELIRTAQDSEILRNVASLSGGSYWPLGRDKVARKVVERVKHDLMASGESMRFAKRSDSWAPALLVLAFVSLLAAVRLD